MGLWRKGFWSQGPALNKALYVPTSHTSEDNGMWSRALGDECSVQGVKMGLNAFRSQALEGFVGVDPLQVPLLLLK